MPDVLKSALLKHEDNLFATFRASSSPTTRIFLAPCSSRASSRLMVQ
nr:unnamed protein product [Callosobruchus analis]